MNEVELGEPPPNMGVSIPGPVGYPEPSMMQTGISLYPVPPFLPYPPIPPIGLIPSYGFPRMLPEIFPQFKKKSKSTPVTCDICHMTVNSQTVYETHLTGKVHQKNLRIAEGKIASMGVLASTAAAAIATKKTKVVYKSQTILTRKKTKTMSDSSYFNKCDVCNKSVNSRRQWEIHLAGSKHQRNVLTSKSKFNPTSFAIEGSSPSVTTEQVQSTKTADDDIEVVTVTLPRGIIVVDEKNQRFICDYCERKVMNSIYQVDQHVQSSEHLKRSGVKVDVHVENLRERVRRCKSRETKVDIRQSEPREGFEEKNLKRMCSVLKHPGEKKGHRKIKSLEVGHSSRQPADRSQLQHNQASDQVQIRQSRHYGSQNHNGCHSSSSSWHHPKRQISQSSKTQRRQLSPSFLQQPSHRPPITQRQNQSRSPSSRHRHQSPSFQRIHNRQRHRASPSRWHHDKFEEEERFHAEMADAVVSKFHKEDSLHSQRVTRGVLEPDETLKWLKNDMKSLDVFSGSKGHVMTPTGHRDHKRPDSLEFERSRDPEKIRQLHPSVNKCLTRDWAERRELQLASFKKGNASKSTSARQQKLFNRDPGHLDGKLDEQRQEIIDGLIIDKDNQMRNSSRRNSLRHYDFALRGEQDNLPSNENQRKRKSQFEHSPSKRKRSGLESEFYQDHRRRDGGRRSAGSRDRSSTDCERGDNSGICDDTDRRSISLTEHLRRDHPHWIEALNKVEEQRQLVREFRGDGDRDSLRRRNRENSPYFDRANYAKAIHESFVRGGIQSS